MKKRLYFIIGIILTLLISITLLFCFRHMIFTSISSVSKVAFSQEAWECNPQNRAAMVEDLMQKYNFLSMTKDEVLALLGTKQLYIGKDTLRYETGGG